MQGSLEDSVRGLRDRVVPLASLSVVGGRRRPVLPRAPPPSAQQAARGPAWPSSQDGRDGALSCSPEHLERKGGHIAQSLV